jgi:uncharacterized FAD-dependent dehydrogenase
MKNPNNLKPIERMDEIADVSQYGASAIIVYFLAELSEKTHHKSFDDKCYWLEVMDEFQKRLNYD